MANLNFLDDKYYCELCEGEQEELFIRENSSGEINGDFSQEFLSLLYDITGDKELRGVGNKLKNFRAITEDDTYLWTIKEGDGSDPESKEEEEDEGEQYKCICSKEIKYRNFIVYIPTNIAIQVGSHCVRKVSEEMYQGMIKGICKVCKIKPIADKRKNIGKNSCCSIGCYQKFLISTVKKEKPISQEKKIITLPPPIIYTPTGDTDSDEDTQDPQFWIRKSLLKNEEEEEEEKKHTSGKCLDCKKYIETIEFGHRCFKCNKKRREEKLNSKEGGYCVDCKKYITTIKFSHRCYECNEKKKYLSHRK